MRAAVGGEVQGKAAEIHFDYAEPLSTVTRGCFAKDEFVESGETVEVATPSGTPQALSMVQVRGVGIGGKRVGGLSAGMVADEARCVLTLGNDALARFAVTIDPATRRLRIEKSKPREAYVEEVSSTKAQEGGEELHLLDVSKEPNADWPLLAIRARQASGQVMGPFIVSLVEPRSSVVDDVAGEAGLVANSEFLEDLPLPVGVKLPEKLSARVFPMDSVELSPGFGFKRAAFTMITGWKKPAALGVIGSDVWGRFRTTLDPNAGVMLLRRPRVFVSGSRQQCASKEPGKISEEACFELADEKQPRGVDATVTLWRDAPDGARVYLELLDDKGAPIRSECRVGVSFGETDRGVSSRHRLPWEGIEKNFPECSQDLLNAKSVALGLYEEGSLPECPGQCGFVHEVMSGRVSCECQTAVGNITDQERKFLELYRQIMRKAKSRIQSPVPERPKFDKDGKEKPKEEPEPEPEEP